MNTLSKKELMHKIQTLDFVAVDLQLYLDTHPTDNRALFMYNNTVMESMALKQMYECQYGPLTSFRSPSAYPWQWNNNPWTWDYSANI